MQALPYSLRAWSMISESYSILYSNENWRMYNGLDFDENFMQQVSAQKANHAELFLSASRRPRRLFLSCIGDVSESKKTAISLALDKARAEKVVSKRGKVPW